MSDYHKDKFFAIVQSSIKKHFDKFHQDLRDETDRVVTYIQEREDQLRKSLEHANHVLTTGGDVVPGKTVRKHNQDTANIK